MWPKASAGLCLAAPATLPKGSGHRRRISCAGRRRAGELVGQQVPQSASLRAMRRSSHARTSGATGGEVSTSAPMASSSRPAAPCTMAARCSTAIATPSHSGRSVAPKRRGAKLHATSMKMPAMCAAQDEDQGVPQHPVFRLRHPRSTRCGCPVDCARGGYCQSSQLQLLGDLKRGLAQAPRLA
jgi:hypothetical protein